MIYLSICVMMLVTYNRDGVAHRVEQQHALIGPRGQVPVGERRAADVVPELVKDVEQAGGAPSAGWDPEAQAAGLIRIKIGVIS